MPSSSQCQRSGDHGWSREAYHLVPTEAGTKSTAVRDVPVGTVSWAAHALFARPTTPILADVRIQTETEELTLPSFNYKVSASFHIPATVEEAGEVLVSGRLLADISKSLPNRPVTIGLDGQKAKLTCGSSHFTLAAIPLDEYPLLPAQPQATGTIDSQVLSQAVSQVLTAASRDDALPLFTDVCMETDGEHMTSLATDRYRPAVRELEWTPVGPALEHITLVKVRILQDVAKSMTSGETAELSISDSSQQGASSLIGFEASGRRTTSTLMNGNYPPVYRLFPESTPIQAVCDRHMLPEAMKRMSLVTERKISARLPLTNGSLVLEARQGDNAQASEAFEASLYGEGIVTAFSPQFFIDGLSVMDTDYMRFGLTHPNEPAVMIGQTKASEGEVTIFRYLLVSIRFGV